jgi:holo-[acyl-carrier protein] synthase
VIIGIGSDIVNIERIEKLVIKYSEKFIKRIFSDDEIVAAQKITNHSKKIQFYAKRFAAKEAFAKALGTGIGKTINFKDISITNNAHGKPMILITKNLDYLTNNHQIHVSLSDDYPCAQAFVIIEQCK